MSSLNQPISTADEIKVVALLARGDTYKSIANEVGIAVSSVNNIRDRNLDTLNNVKTELIVHQTKQAKRLLDKSHSLLDKRLSAEQDVLDERDNLKELYDEGKITYSQYLSGLRAHAPLTLAELTALSKEMFNQSQIEDGKPTSIPGGAGSTSKEAEQKLAELIEALHGNDKDNYLELIND